MHEIFKAISPLKHLLMLTSWGNKIKKKKKKSTFLSFNLSIHTKFLTLNIDIILGKIAQHLRGVKTQNMEKYLNYTLILVKVGCLKK